jgi:hypothetical protein
MTPLHHNIVANDEIESDLFYVKFDEKHDFLVKIEKKWRVQGVFLQYATYVIHIY